MRSPRWLTLGRAGLLVSLVAIWTLLWGEVSVGNVISGTLVAVTLLIVFPLSAVEHVDHRVHLWSIVRLAAFFVYDLVVSTLRVGWDVLVGPRRVRTAIVACPLRVDADGLVTFLANILALSPGTLPIHVSKEPLVLYVHVLRLDSPDAVRARVARLEERAVAALGSPAMVEACRVAPPHPDDLRLETPPPQTQEPA